MPYGLLAPRHLQLPLFSEKQQGEGAANEGAIGSSPAIVFGLGGLVLYGRENTEARGIERFYDLGTNYPNAVDDPFALDLSCDEKLREMYLEAEAG